MSLKFDQEVVGFLSDKAIIDFGCGTPRSNQFEGWRLGGYPPRFLRSMHTRRIGAQLIGVDIYPQALLDHLVFKQITCDMVAGILDGSLSGSIQSAASMPIGLVITERTVIDVSPTLKKCVEERGMTTTEFGSVLRQFMGDILCDRGYMIFEGETCQKISGQIQYI